MIIENILTEHDCDVNDLNEKFLYTTHRNIESMKKWLQNRWFTMTNMDLVFMQEDNNLMKYKLIAIRGDKNKEFILTIGKSQNMTSLVIKNIE